MPSLSWAPGLSARGIFHRSLTPGVIKYLNGNRQKWCGGRSISEINGSYKCKVSNHNGKNVEGQEAANRPVKRGSKTESKQDSENTWQEGGWRKEVKLRENQVMLKAERMFQGSERVMGREIKANENWF